MAVQGTELDPHSGKEKTILGVRHYFDAGAEGLDEKGRSMYDPCWIIIGRLYEYGGHRRGHVCSTE